MITISMHATIRNVLHMYIIMSECHVKSVLLVMTGRATACMGLAFYASAANWQVSSQLMKEMLWCSISLAKKYGTWVSRRPRTPQLEGGQS